MNRKNGTRLAVLSLVAAVLSFLIKAQGLDEGPPPKKPDPTWLTRDSSTSPEFRFFKVQYERLLSGFTGMGISFYEDVFDDFSQDGRTLYVTPDPKWAESEVTFPLDIVHKMWRNANGGDKEVTVYVLNGDGETVAEKTQ